MENAVVTQVSMIVSILVSIIACFTEEPRVKLVLAAIIIVLVIIAASFALATQGSYTYV